MHRLRDTALPIALSLALVTSACGRNVAPDAGESTGAVGTEDQTQMITHEFGTTETPSDPQRVVVLDDTSLLSVALRLDVPIVATAFQPYGEGHLPYFPDEPFEAMEDVGWEISVEAVAAVKPDLIVGDTGKVDENLYQLLEPIAPTVIFEHFGDTPWKEAVREAAVVFGGAEEIDEDIAAFEARVAELRTTLGDRVDETTVSLANFRALDDIRIISSNWCSSSVLEEIGFSRPPNQQSDEETKLSIERLSEVDADTLFYFVGSTATDPEAAAQAEAAIMSNPLWENLEAVQSRQVHRVDPTHWFTCTSLPAQNLVLDDLERILLGDPQ